MTGSEDVEAEETEAGETGSEETGETETEQAESNETEAGEAEETETEVIEAEAGETEPEQQPVEEPAAPAQPDPNNGGIEEPGFEGQVLQLVFALTVDGEALPLIPVQIDPGAVGHAVELTGDAKAKVEALEAGGYTLTWYKDAGHSEALANGLADVTVTGGLNQRVYGAAVKAAEPEEILTDEPMAIDEEVGTYSVVDDWAVVNDFAGLKAALEANEKNIKLTGPVTADYPGMRVYESPGTGVINIDGDDRGTELITIDGQGNSIIAGAGFPVVGDKAQYHLLNISDGARVTLKNVTFDGGDLNKHVRSVVNVCDRSASATLEGVIISGGTVYGVCCNNASVAITAGSNVSSAGVDKEGSLTVNENGHIDSLMVENGSATVQDNATVKGLAAYNSSNANVTVEGGNITNATMYLGTFTMTGGEVGTLTVAEGGEATLTGGHIETLSSTTATLHICPDMDITTGEPEYVATAAVDGKTFKYATLAEAVAAADAGSTVALLQNVTAAGPIDVTGSVTIDGTNAGGENYTITRAGDALSSALFNITGSLILKNATLKDSSGEGHAATQSLLLTSGASSYLEINNVTIDGVYFTGNGTNCGGAIHVAEGHAALNNSVIKNCIATVYTAALYCSGGAQVTMDGMEITGNRCLEDYGNPANMSIIRIYGNATRLEMKGETTVHDNYYHANGLIGVYEGEFVMQNGSITHNEYTFGGETNNFGSPVHVWFGTFTMNDGEISNNINIDGPFKTSGVGAGRDEAKIHLNGGSITTPNDGTFALFVNNDDATIGTNFHIYGDVQIYDGQLTNNGTIEGKVYTQDNLAVQGSQPTGGYDESVIALVQGSDGKYTTYETLADAVAAASVNNGTVELLKSVTESGITVSGNVTVKAAEGITLTRADGSTVFSVTSGSLTLEGLEINGNNVDADSPLINMVAGTALTVDGCNIHNVHSNKGGGIIKSVGAEGKTTTVDLKNSSVTDCYTASNGLVMYTERTKVTVTDTLVSGNASNPEADANEVLFNINQHSDLTIGSGTRIIGNQYHGNGLVALQNGSTATMEPGSEISGNTFTYYGPNNHYGSPVHLYSGSEFTMNGGTISGNFGGYTSVFGLKGNSKLHLNNGTITDNHSFTGYDTLVFTITGTENTVDVGTGMVADGDIWLYQGTITNNGTVNGDVYLLAPDPSHGAAGSFSNLGTLNGTVYFDNNGPSLPTYTGSSPVNGVGWTNGDQTGPTNTSLAPNTTNHIAFDAAGITINVKCAANASHAKTIKIKPDEFAFGAVQYDAATGTIYTLATLDKAQALQAHEEGLGPKHTAIGNITVKLVYQDGKWVCSDVIDAIDNAFCSYTVTWDPNNGEPSETVRVEHIGDREPTEHAAPTLADYVFNGWARSVDPATGNVTYTAQWRLYAVNWGNPSSGNNAPAEDDDDEEPDTAVTAPAAPAAPAPAVTVSPARRPAYTAGTAVTAPAADDTGAEVEIQEDDTPLAAAPAPVEPEEPAPEQPEEDVTGIEEDDTPLAAAPAQTERSFNWLPLLLIPVALGGILLIILLWRKKREEEEAR